MSSRLRSLAVLTAVLCAVARPAAWAQCPDGSPPPCTAARAAAPRLAAPPAAKERARHLLLLPFRNVTRRAEQEWLVTGAPLMLGQALGQFRDLDVVSPERLDAARRRVGVSVDSVPDAARLARLGAETGAWTAVTGNIFAAGPRLRVTLQVLDLPASRVILTAEHEVDASADLRGMFDTLSVRILEPTGVPPSGSSLVALSTKSVSAYREYVQGLDLYHRSAYRSALEAFTRATRLDSTFAVAWSRLAFTSVSVRGFQEMLNPASALYRAIDRSMRYAQQLPPSEAAQLRSMQAFVRAQWSLSRRIADSLATADPRNIDALEWLAILESMSGIVSRTTNTAIMTADINRAMRLVRQLLDVAPTREMAFSLPAMTYGLAGGMWWGVTWADAREYPSLPFLLMAAVNAPQTTFVPLLRDSLTFMPKDSFVALPRETREALRRHGANRAMDWVQEWLLASPNNPDAHLWASRIAEVQDDFPRARRELDIADSLGIQTGYESIPGRRLSLLVLSRDYDRAGRLADSLLATGAMQGAPAISYVDRRWTYGAAAFLLARRWGSAAAFAQLANATWHLPAACDALRHSLTTTDGSAPESVRRAVMDSVSAHLAEVNAVPALAPCSVVLSARLLVGPWRQFCSVRAGRWRPWANGRDEGEAGSRMV